MMDQTPEVQADPVVKVARDLTEIAALHAELGEQAATLARAKVDGTSLPGGRAMVALTPVGSPDEWAEQIAYAELHHLATCPKPHHRDCQYAEHVADGDDDVSPLQTLMFWSEQWREIHGSPLGDRRPTEASEANYIRWALDWAWDNEARWDDFANDIRLVRVQLENLLYAGKRAETSRVNCPNTDCGKRLIRVYARREHFANECTRCGDLTDPGPTGDCRACSAGATVEVWQSDESDDHHKCPACKNRYDATEYRKALSQQLRSEGAKRWVLKVDAVAVLRDQGRPKDTIRKWFGGDEMRTDRDDQGRPIVWWPDLWTLHLTTPSRKRAS